jgi:hypothetical protein
MPPSDRFGAQAVISRSPAEALPPRSVTRTLWVRRALEPEAEDASNVTAFCPWLLAYSAALATFVVGRVHAKLRPASKRRQTYQLHRAEFPGE